ncbi:creatininase family protein [Trebonia kvetii]|uniref:creatininase family protein n=1 Tax=Trebonia kvetii TaxID=2480626 RepID=UPI00319E690A
MAEVVKPRSLEQAVRRVGARFLALAAVPSSILLHAHPELVRDGYESADWTANDRQHLLINSTAAYTRSGVIGRPSLGSADKGKVALASLVRSFADVLQALE